jgi:hypothetical protein
VPPTKTTTETRNFNHTKHEQAPSLILTYRAGRDRCASQAINFLSFGSAVGLSAYFAMPSRELQRLTSTTPMGPGYYKKLEFQGAKLEVELWKKKPKKAKASAMDAQPSDLRPARSAKPPAAFVAGPASIRADGEGNVKVAPKKPKPRPKELPPGTWTAAPLTRGWLTSRLILSRWCLRVAAEQRRSCSVLRSARRSTVSA